MKFLPLILGIISIILFLLAVYLPTVVFFGVVQQMDLSIVLLITGITLGVKNVNKTSHNKTVIFGIIVSVLALLLILGVMILGHYILYGSIGI